MLRRFVFRTGGPDRRRHLGRVVAGVIGMRRDEGRMRPVIAQMQEPGLAPGPLHVGQAMLGRPGRIGVAGIDPRRRPGGAGTRGARLRGLPDVFRVRRDIDALLAQPVEIGPPARFQRRHHVPARHVMAEVIEAGVVGRCRAGVGGGRGVADQRRVVARFPQGVRQAVMPRIHGHAVLHDPVVHHILAGQQRRPGRSARHPLGIIVAEGDAVAAQHVQVRRPDARMAEHAHRIAAPLINDDQQDVLFFSHDEIPPDAFSR